MSSSIGAHPVATMGMLSEDVTLEGGPFLIECMGRVCLSLDADEATALANKCCYFRGVWSSGCRESQSQTLHWEETPVKAAQIVVNLVLKNEISICMFTYDQEEKCLEAAPGNQKETGLSTNTTSLYGHVQEYVDLLLLNVYYPDPRDSTKNLFLDDARTMSKTMQAYSWLEEQDGVSQITIFSPSIRNMRQSDRIEFMDDLLDSSIVTFVGDGSMGPQVKMLEKIPDLASYPNHVKYCFTGKMDCGSLFSHVFRCMFHKQGRGWHQDNGGNQIKITMPLCLGTTESLHAWMPKAKRKGSITYDSPTYNKEIMTWKANLNAIAEAKEILSLSKRSLLMNVSNEDGNYHVPQCKVELFRPRQDYLVSFIAALCQLEVGSFKHLEWLSNQGRFTVDTTHTAASFIVNFMEGPKNRLTHQSDEFSILTVNESISTIIL